LHTFEVLAEVGVVLLMFSIGVEFSIPELMRVKSVALVGGPIGILLWCFSHSAPDECSAGL
jgi:monovalent cation:H+ antiporter-2, CPA2 family